MLITLLLTPFTKIITMPIPRFDSCWSLMWSFQMEMAHGRHFRLQPNMCCQIILREACISSPNCTKFTYSVMLFSPINGPVIFIFFIRDMDSTWKGVAATQGIVIDSKTGTRLIVDDIYSLAHSFVEFFEYLKCQLDVCLSQNISLSLKKCLFCPERMEFVGRDVCININRPAQLKPSMMKTWPPFEVT